MMSTRPEQERRWGTVGPGLSKQVLRGSEPNAGEPQPAGLAEAAAPPQHKRESAACSQARQALTSKQTNEPLQMKAKQLLHQGKELGKHPLRGFSSSASQIRCQLLPCLNVCVCVCV